MSLYNKFTLPITDAISDALGMVSARWRLFFQNQLSLNNSLTTRWVLYSGGGIATTDAVTLIKTAGENVTFMFPTGSRIMVRDGSSLYFGTVESCTYSAGTAAVTWKLDMDSGYALNAVSEIYYGVLTSSVIY
jgi:hypothetical protein